MIELSASSSRFDLFFSQSERSAEKMLKNFLSHLWNTTAACYRLTSRNLTSLSTLPSPKKTLDNTQKYGTRNTQKYGTLPEIPYHEREGAKTSYFHPFWKPGSGYYSDTLGRVSRNLMDLCEDIVSHIDSVPVPSKKGVFTIGDYGTCDGFVSMQLMHKIIDHLRKKNGPDLNIQVLYEDQPSNDFNSLFKQIYDESSYMSKFDNVFPVVCGTSFYKQCVPENSCDVIISSIALHWLSDESVLKCSDSVFPWCSTSEEELRAYHEASARDFEKFLVLRAKELKPGGLLFVMQLTTKPRSGSSQIPDLRTTDPDSVSGAPEELYRDSFLTVASSWKQLLVEGSITREEWQTCVAPVAPRTLQEVKAPFENASTSPVRQAGLHLLQEPELVYAPFFKQMWRQKLQTDGVDDRDYFADLVSKAMRVGLEATFRNSLMGSRPAEEKSAIIEQLFEKFRRKVASCNPETFQAEAISTILVAQKLN